MLLLIDLHRENITLANSGYFIQAFGFYFSQRSNNYMGFQSTGGAGRRCRDRIVVGFTTPYAISAHHHKRCEFESRSNDP